MAQQFEKKDILNKTMNFIDYSQGLCETDHDVQHLSVTEIRQMPSSEGLLLSTGKEYASLIKHMHSISVAEIFFVETPTRRQSNYSRKIKTAHIIPLYKHTFPVFTKCLMQQTYDLTKLFARIVGQLRA